MRVVIQRVSKPAGAAVLIDGSETRGFEGRGLMILVGIEEADGMEDVEWLAGKIAKMRIFADGNNAMNLSVTDVAGSVLVISQFTLHASTKKGNRPSFTGAAKPETAIPLYKLFLKLLANIVGEEKVKAGEFGADMQVSFTNDGPVTIVMDSKNRE